MLLEIAVFLLGIVVLVLLIHVWRLEIRIDKDMKQAKQNLDLMKVTFDNVWREIYAVKYDVRQLWKGN